MKRILLLTVSFLLLTMLVSAQKPLKQMTFKNKKETIYLIRFDKTISEKFLNDYCKKNGYKFGDTSDLKFLTQRKLPLHCCVYAFEYKKSKSKNVLMSCKIETNGYTSAYYPHQGSLHYEEVYIHNYTDEFTNFHSEEEGDVEHFICLKK